jgi:hypothetical protein
MFCYKYVRGTSNYYSQQNVSHVVLICLLKDCLLWSKIVKFRIHTWWDNKVRKIAIVCLPRQHWTKDLAGFDDVYISSFHSCVVVDLWQSLFEWHLLLSACVLVCHPRGCRSLNYSSEQTLNFLLNLERC